MLSLFFQGWFQCRLATDPDPCDESQGVSGWTFALPGEPDLDRTIRTRPERAVRRRLGPPVGVSVREVLYPGQPHPRVSPLLGAPVELLDDPVFEGRNGLQAEDGQEPIFPFHLRIQKDGVLLRREHRQPETGEWLKQRSLSAGLWPGDVGSVLELPDPARYLEERKRMLSEALKATMKSVRRQQLEQRLKQLETQPLSLTVIEAFRTRRWLQLQKVLAEEQEPVARLALEKRLRDMLDGVLGQQEFVMNGAVRYRYELKGPRVENTDTYGLLGGTIEQGAWIADFWMGIWDADALSGYMQGTLEVPFRPATQC